MELLLLVIAVALVVLSITVGGMYLLNRAIDGSNR
jgi:hypothetical protein